MTRRNLSPLLSWSLPALVALALALAGCTGLPSQAAPGPAAPASLSNVASTPQLGQVVVTGLVTSISNGKISVGDLTFRVDDQTQLPAGLQAGSPARVLAIRLPDNTHYALEVSSAPAPNPASTPSVGHAPSGEGEFEMYGRVQSIGADGWQVSDMPLQVPEEASVKGNIQAGDIVRIEGVTSGGVMKAREIDLFASTAVTPAANAPEGQAASPDGEEHELYGVVESQGDSWSVSGTTFVVDGSTRLSGNLAVGSSVKVHYLQKADGSFLATKIEADTESESYNNTPTTGDHSTDSQHSNQESQHHSSGESYESGESHDSGESHH